MFSPMVQKKVLVVDDDQLVRDVLAMHLKEFSFEPITAASGLEALTLLENGKHLFVAAIVDRMMPGMDGTDLTKKIKANPVFSNIPIIMLTSAAERIHMIDAVQGGVFDFLIKPIEKELLMLVLKRAIGISQISVGS
jgi:CheY-like chemotaxis protein